MGDEPDCKGCRSCGGKTKTINSRTSMKYGFTTVWRRKCCLDCDERYNTVEIDEQSANEFYVED